MCVSREMCAYLAKCVRISQNVYVSREMCAYLAKCVRLVSIFVIKCLCRECNTRITQEEMIIGGQQPWSRHSCRLMQNEEDWVCEVGAR